jgi:hypothetical protein
MTVCVNRADAQVAQPGLASSLVALNGRVPKLVAIIIQVAVPGPA